jgi:uncharacterized OsmC-like protein
MVQVRPKTVISAKVTGDSPSHSLTHISVRDVGMDIDEPLERDGTNTGPSPTETAIAALVACTNVIGHKCAKMLEVDIGHLHISADYEFDRRGVTLAEEVDVPFRRVKLTVESDGNASDEDLTRVARDVAKFCPVSKLFRQAGTQIEEIWRRRQN